MDRMDGVDPWWRGAVIYQIWPRSFNDSDGDGIGDLRGITERLDYLNDGGGGGLGVDAIWISPFFVSPLADYGYDISDYKAIDPTFGSFETFDQLIAEADRRSVKVLLDLVPNHTSIQHAWFQESRQSRHNPKRDWYVWRDPGEDGGPPNNWISAFAGVGPAWTLDEVTGQYYLHSYTPSQPDLNWENPEVQGAIKDVMRFWLDRGVSGFRIDVVHRLAKDPDLGDNPGGIEGLEPETPGRHDADWETIDDRLAELRKVADEYENRLLVGEVYVLDQSRLVAYLGDGKLHLGHNFVFFNQSWSCDAIPSVIEEFEELSGPRIDGAWCLNNHDHPRVITRFGSDGYGVEKGRAAAVLLLGLEGTAFIYQGEELGLPDSDVPLDLVVDVDGRDPCRTPIPWDSPLEAGPGAGFTEGVPWLPIGSGAEQLNAAFQATDSRSMHALYRHLIELRRSTPAVRRGTFVSRGCVDDVFVFDREHGGDRVGVIVNFGPRSLALMAISERLDANLSSLELLVSSNPDADRLSLAPFEARWMRQVNPQKTS